MLCCAVVVGVSREFSCMRCDSVGLRSAYTRLPSLRSIFSRSNPFQYSIWPCTLSGRRKSRGKRHLVIPSLRKLASASIVFPVDLPGASAVNVSSALLLKYLPASVPPSPIRLHATERHQNIPLVGWPFVGIRLAKGAGTR